MVMRLKRCFVWSENQQLNICISSVKQNKKITDYEEESDEERVMNAKLLERLRDMIMTSEIDTEGQGAKSSLRLV